MIVKFGERIIEFFVNFGYISRLFYQSILCLFNGKRKVKKSIEQMYYLGIKSLPITVITAAFVGAAFTIQVVREFLRFGAGEMIGGVVGIGIWRELAPMLTAVVVAGRVGAAMSAELGSMKVTEQVEALEAMSQDPVDFLVVPRLVACTLMMPLLVGIADIVGFLAGFLVALATGRINPYAYFESAQRMLTVMDITGGMIKAIFFGIVVALVSTYMGLKTRGGAKGVGEMTTQAVVVSLIVIFILNYFMSIIIY